MNSPGKNIKAAHAPLVSVVVPAFNVQTTLARALRSVVAQTYRPIELCIVDDGSVDNTFELAKTFEAADIKVTVHRLDSNRGASAARNAAIDLARGEFVAFLDANAEWMPLKLESQIAAYAANPSLAFVYSEAALVGPGDKDLGLISPKRLRPEGKDGWKTLLRYPTVTTPTVLTRASLLREVGGFDSTLAIGEDQDLWIKLALRGEIRYMNQTLSRVHDRHDNLSNFQRLQSKYTTVQMILNHLAALRSKLTHSEIRQILAERYAAIGRHFYEAGETREGIRNLVKALRHGNSPTITLRNLIADSPSARFCKRFLRKETQWANGSSLAVWPKGARPMLTVIIDTEEEFDWRTPFDTAERDVQAIRKLSVLQSIFERHGVVPTYVVDYAIVDSDLGVDALKPLVDSGKAIVGAHLHPWVNPPFGEKMESKNTYPGNLQFELEFKKLEMLTARIEQRLGVRPRIYRAGRYGFGTSTVQVLQSLGYEIDSSILPTTSLQSDGGPDFSDFISSPFWLGETLDLFELPLSRGFSGQLHKFGPAIAPLIFGRIGMRLMLPGVLARLGLLERGTLTPEGMTLVEMKRLTQSMLRGGSKLLCMSLHSSTILPRKSNLYVKDERELSEFLARIDGYLTWFSTEYNSTFVTPFEARDIASSARKEIDTRSLYHSSSTAHTPA